MDLPFELHIALRYLLAKRKQAFISVISLISTVGVGVGVAAVVIALAVMTGLQQELRDRILGSNPHVYVSRVGGLDNYRAEPILYHPIESAGSSTVRFIACGRDPFFPPWRDVALLNYFNPATRHGWARARLQSSGRSSAWRPSSSSASSCSSRAISRSSSSRSASPSAKSS